MKKSWQRWRTFDPHDLWVGVYWKEEIFGMPMESCDATHELTIYIVPIPTIVFVFRRTVERA